LSASNGCGQVSLRRNKPAITNALSRNTNNAGLLSFRKQDISQAPMQATKKPDLNEAGLFCCMGA
jgi:hypothetical protein